MIPERFTAQIKKIIFFNVENSFVIMSVENFFDKCVVKGTFPDLLLLEDLETAKGLECEIEGSWTDHPRYGRQFNATSIKLQQQGLFFFLTHMVKGVGKKLAELLTYKFREEELINILENDPQQLLKIKGIREKKLDSIVESWNKYKNLRNLSDFFVNHKVEISTSLLFRIYSYFTENSKDAITEITENPYCLTDIKGIGFKTADYIAVQLGIEMLAPIRIKAAIDYILLSEASDNGHTFLKYSYFLERAQIFLCIGSLDNLDIDELDIKLKEVLNSGSYYYDGEIVSLKSFKYEEEFIEDNLKQKLENSNNYVISLEEAEKFIQEKEKELGIILDDKQRDVIYDIATDGNNVFALCGYAGTGKSTISKIILDLYKTYFFDEDQITCCAFTGMASKRIQELTGYQAHTIHSLLGIRQSTKTFAYGRDNPLPYKVILVDESSMVNLSLFYALIRAVPKSTILIMVGDDAQLPPIGEGNVFNDLLQKDWIPKIKLEKIFRQSEDSVLSYFASKIRQAEVPDKLYGVYKDFSYIYKDMPNYWVLKKELPEDQLRLIRDKFYQEVQIEFLSEIDNYIKLNNITGLDKIWNVQVITPMKITPLGTIALNKLLQERINDFEGQKIQIRGALLKEKDKVIHLKNQDMKTFSNKQYTQLYNKYKNLKDIYDYIKTPNERIYNGSVGLVVNIDKTNGFFSVAYPDPDESYIIVLYQFDDFQNIVDLGYALTIHKTQGNQFDHVFIPMINSFYIMLNTKLLYTAVTRARKKCVIMGQMSALKKGCTNLEKLTRNTFLSRKNSDSSKELVKNLGGVFQGHALKDKSMVEIFDLENKISEEAFTEKFIL